MTVGNKEKKPSVFGLRLPDKLKQRCEVLAEKKGLSLNEWIKRTLDSAVDDGEDTQYQELLGIIDEYISSPENDRSIENRRGFIWCAGIEFMNAERCPRCDEYNLPGSSYCSSCGYQIRWHSPLEKYAVAYFEDYKKNNWLVGWQYMLVVPESMDEPEEFIILKEHLPRLPTDYPVFVKRLTPDDISCGKGIYEKKTPEYVKIIDENNDTDMSRYPRKTTNKRHYPKSDY